MLRKRVAFLRRTPELSFAEFDRHWATGHAEIIVELPGLKEYVQNSVRRAWGTNEDMPRIDGIVEVWFNDEFVTSAEEHTSAAQREDEVLFLSSLTAFTTANVASYSVEEKVWIVADGPIELPPGIVRRKVVPMSPERGTVLMQRPRLDREPDPPQFLVAIPVSADSSETSDAIFEAVRQDILERPQATQVRVLKTTSRRMR